MTEWMQLEAAEGVVLRVTAGPAGIRSIEINPRREPAGARNDENPMLKEAAAQLRDYFAGRRRGFDLPLDPHGTEFQRRVWQALAEIPYGETRSYRDIAGAPWACPAPCAPSARPMAAILCRYSCHATGSSALTANWSATREACA